MYLTRHGLSNAKGFQMVMSGSKVLL